MPKYDFDLFIIGAGSGGVRATRMASQYGARVGIAEADRFGGTCVVRGCIPKKLFVYASHFAEEFEDAVGFGWSPMHPTFDWPTLIANKDAEIARLEGLYKQTLENAGAEIFPERAVLKNAHTVHLANENRDVTAEYILIATGGYPSRNLGGGATGADLCITSDEAFHLPELPERVVIAGGGYIALEFAHIFHGLGVDTTVVYRGPRILRGWDDCLHDALVESMSNKGIRLVLNTVFTRVERRGKGLRAHLKTGDALDADRVMLAIGREPNTYGLGLEHAGVDLREKDRAIMVDEYSRTTAPNIYAVGDVTNRLQLTPVAIHEAMCFAKTVFGGAPTRPDHECVATAVFTRPEIGTVGMTEATALRRGHTVDVYMTKFKPLKHTLSGREERATMKLVVDAKTDKVLGCHIFAPDAGEMCQLVAIAMKMGATKGQFDATVAVHPTVAEELVTLRTKSYTKAPDAAAAG
jgi:glutathione reductase (NADPH)